MSEGKVEANGMTIWYQDFGDRTNPTVLFVMGAGAQGLWPPDLIQPIVDTGYHVVCFDNRDIGLSTWINDFATNPYTLADMAADAVGLMDALKVKQAHVVGMSMGGMIAQLVAINYPDRVLTLTSWASTYWWMDPDVPAMSDRVQALLREITMSPPTTREEMIESNVTLYRTLAGSRFAFDEKGTRAIQAILVDRGHNPKNSHGLATNAAPSRLDALRKLAVPTLVIHGDEDPIISYTHGVVCAKVIPGAKLVTQKGVGHEIPMPLAQEIAQALIAHFNSVK